MLVFRRAGQRLVLRLPPEHKRPRSDDTIRREARVLGALSGSAVPHARLVAACDDVETLGSAFFVSEFVSGVSLWSELPWADPVLQHRAGSSVVDAFATLACIDVEAVGLRDLSNRDGWLARQPARWHDLLASHCDLDGVGTSRLPGVADVHDWLLASLPDDWTPGLVHGDAHLGNVLVDPRGATVTAIVDWELSAIGDPLLDLGQLLVTWPATGVYADRVDAPGLPTRTEVVDGWAARSGRDVQDLNWFEVLAAYRLAVLLEGTSARANAGLAPVTTGLALHARAVALVEHARRRSHVGLRD
jgi:aminoglycoside phosphotransferase (APT) family kinase protein